MSTEYIGFTLGGYHSDEFGVKRVSQNNRYKEEIVPKRQENQINKEGADGTYYWGGKIQQRQIPIDFAFDSMSEEQHNLFKRLINFKYPQELILDEHPNRVYTGKISDSATIDSLCFLENGERVHKGEGSFNFTCYFPYAKGPKQQVTISNILTEIDNDGDIDIPFKVYIRVNSTILQHGFTFRLNSRNELRFAFSEWNSPPIDSTIVVDFYNQIIVDSITDKIYTGIIRQGTFFSLPKGKSKITLSNTDGVLEYCKYYI